MANPGRGEVALVVDGGTALTLRLTTGALSSLQNAMGLEPTADGCAKFLARLAQLGAADASEWAQLLFLSTRENHAKKIPSAEAAAELLLGLPTRQALLGAMEAMRQTIVSAFPEPSDKEGSGELFTWTGLLTAALRSGMTHREFWSHTPREVSQVILADAWRRKELTRLAWQNAVWSQLGKSTPKFDELFPKAGTPSPILDAEKAKAQLQDFALTSGMSFRKAN